MLCCRSDDGVRRQRPVAGGAPGAHAVSITRGGDALLVVGVVGVVVVGVGVQQQQPAQRVQQGADRAGH